MASHTPSKQRLDMTYRGPQAPREYVSLRTRRRPLSVPKSRGQRKKKAILLVAATAIVALALSYGLSGIHRRFYATGKPPGKRLPSGESNLPSVDEAEQDLTPAVQKGKDFVAKALKSAEKAREQAGDPHPSGGAEEALAMLARHASGGKTEDLVGQTIVLEDFTPLDGSVPTADLRRLKVTKFLGEKPSTLVLEVLDEDTHQQFALRVPFMANELEEEEESSADEAEEPDSASKAFSRLSTRIQFGMKTEESGIRKALGNIRAVEAASQRGIAVPLETAWISGIEGGLFSGAIFVSGKVHLVERLHGDLKELLETAGAVPMEAKEYIARRLLLQVLHLQEVELCHHDVNLNNCFMRSDGTFLLGNFGSSAPAGELLNVFSETAPAYTEPRLILDFFDAVETGNDLKAHLSSDLWSCGVAIYELFTGKLPYGLTGVANDFLAIHQRVSSLTEHGAPQEELNLEMNKVGMPEKWQKLLSRLLEVDRQNRITAAEIASEFSDLIWN